MGRPRSNKINVVSQLSARLLTRSYWVCFTSVIRHRRCGSAILVSHIYSTTRQRPGWVTFLRNAISRAYTTVSFIIVAALSKLPDRQSAILSISRAEHGADDLPAHPITHLPQPLMIGNA
jgi:hypothetical protein